MGRRARNVAPTDPIGAADAILADPRVRWVPIKHYSPACAWHVAALIREVRPAAVLVEGPDDATELLPYVVDPETVPPITVLSTYVDERNKFGQNGILSSSPEAPARYRGWWPLVPYAPEYAALTAGAEVGAELRFIDAPLPATIPVHHVRRHERNQSVDDRLLAENRYFAALGAHGRRRSFDEFWEATFETGAPHASTEAFFRSVLVFAWCARNVADTASLEADGTLLREAHMRWHIDQALQSAGEAPVVVVTGAFHTVALPWTKRKRAAAKADRYTTTMLCAHSFRALASLYGMNRQPAYGQAVHEAMLDGVDRPYDAAAERLIVEIMREARERGNLVSTADSVGALQVAHGLARLRGNPEITRDDLLDAVQATYVKGELDQVGGPILDAARAVLVGHRMGRVTALAGQVPLIRDYYEEGKRHRLDLSGAHKKVRCDLLRQERHRRKSAFLHRCAFLDIPMFEGIDDGRGPIYRGPDLAAGEDLHLLGETWGVRWSEEVDDRLLELSDRGTSVGEVAGSLLAEGLGAVRSDVAASTRLLLQSAQMLLLELFEDAVAAVVGAVATDGSFDHLVRALADLVLLHSYRGALATAEDPRVAELIGAVHTRACLALPPIRNVEPESAPEALDRLQTLVRITLTFDAVALDARLLVEKVREMVADEGGEPVLRGAGYGVLHGFGATREAVVARALEAYAGGTAEKARGAGAFLDGLFLTSKGVFLRSPRLLRAVDRVIAGLDWETFKLLLPDLRRAFTRFIPTELDAIGVRVARELGGGDRASSHEALPDSTIQLVRAADQRVGACLAALEGDTP